MANKIINNYSFNFGFGNVEYYLKNTENTYTKTHYYVGANGTYSINIENIELFVKTFGSNLNPKNIYIKTIQIIRNIGIKALNEFIDENASVNALTSSKEKYENIFLNLASNDVSLSEMGITISNITIDSIYFRNDDLEPITIIDNKRTKKIKRLVLISSIILFAILVAFVVIIALPKPSSQPIEEFPYEVGETLIDTENGTQYIVNEQKTLTFSKFSGNHKEFTIPSSFNGIKVTKVGDGAFAHNTYVIDNLILSEGIEELEESAFIFSNIKHITIPSTLKTIDLWQNAFRFNKFLDFTVSPENKYFKTDESNKYLLSIDGTELYAYASGLDEESPIIPASVNTIQNQAFSGSSIKEIIIPDGVETIYFSAFLECNKLEYAYIPKSVSYLPGSTFSCARNLKEIKVDENNERFYAENGILYERISDKPDDIMIIHIPAKLVSKEYKIPSCAYIGSGLMCGNEKIVILTIPDGVINIFGQSFIFCTNLKVVYIPSSVTYIENDIFEYDYASELHKTIYGQEYSQAEESAEIFGYAFAAVRIENNEMHITKINLNGQTSVDIPESIDGYKIVIDEHAFDGIKNIIIYGEANGYVQSFAEANGFKYRIGF